jgi:hypothetical protein
MRRSKQTVPGLWRASRYRPPGTLLLQIFVPSVRGPPELRQFVLSVNNIFILLNVVFRLIPIYGLRPGSPIQRLRKRLSCPLTFSSLLFLYTALMPFDPAMFAAHFVQTGQLLHQFQSDPPDNTNTWIANSGATHHFCNRKSWFAKYFEDPMPIHTGNGIVVSPGYGTVHLNLRRSKGDTQPLTLSRVRYTPFRAINTVSEDLLERRGIVWNRKLQQFIHDPTGAEFTSVSKQNGLKVLDVAPTPTNALLASDPSPDITLLHRRLGHLHIDGVKTLLQHEALPTPPSMTLPGCDACF